MRAEQGYTLMELVIVILLLGIVTTYVIGRSGSDFKAVADAEELLQAIRYTQERAMQHTGDEVNYPYRISLGAAGYKLLPAAAPAYATTLDGTFQGDGVSPTGIIAFDGRGTPLCSAGLSCTSASQNLNVSASGETVVVTLQPYTGYVGR
jgi:prepilin-type N-terminal cleavage/methylation domain-containing protein